jgi:glycyl-tRNA synthetase
VLLVPLSNNSAFTPHLQRLSQRLRTLGISNRTDDSSATIGKRYSRNDELGTPLGVTVDFQTVKDGSITLRDRDTTKQVRASEDEITKAIESIVRGDESWEDVAKRLPEFTGQDVD